MKKVSWENIFPAISIPLNEDFSINEQELRKYVAWLADFEGIDGLVCNGHTGEITSFNREERKRIVEIVADEVGDRVMIISGVCAEGTLEAIDHARDAQDAGADGILLMPPHIWLRFGMKQSSAVTFFKKVADAIDIGIIIHLYPYSTKAFYPVETVLEISKIENVKALKIGTRQMAVYERDIRILREQAPELKILTCHDEYLLSSMYVGVDGALIGFGNCIPELITEAWQAVKANDFVKTRELQEKIFPMAEAIYGIGQPSGEAHARMKEVIHQRGFFTTGLMREPVMPLDQDEVKKVKYALTKAGL
ncbi:dihydrodipicolinate synthase family protein [Fusibacter paucivorans]|uniref:Dihydrodipicolinate synthase family protein n=1 Tax=Fusibacter paucivorans TaxID=76009 RepID=A0ABS5PSJ9_9FIRM|nr:dihydrodipicolinate synthase family protein [Fusibacter paucivorans]MBS7527521.1 dihydrodipicolinate synthase family protein [Fusibacter paucivorans]